MKNIILILSFLLSTNAFAALSPLDKCNADPTNSLANPCGLSGKASWTVGTGATFGTSTSPTFQNDPQVIKLTLSSASGDLLSQDVTGTFSGVNLENSMWVYAPTSGVTLQVCARLSAADVSGACVSVPNIGGWAYVPASSVGGSGSAGVSLFASASSTGTVYVTHGYVGRNRNLSNATPITAWQSYTPTFAGLGTPTGIQMQYRQVGDSLELQGIFTTGTATASTASMSLPSGLVIDTSKLSGASSNAQVGFGAQSAAAGAGAILTVLASPGTSTSNLYFSFVGTGGTSNPLSPANGSAAFNNATLTSIHAFVPIVSFAASVPIASLATVTSMWSGSIAGSGGGWSTTGTSYGDFSVATTSTTLTQNVSVNGGSVIAEATKLPAITDQSLQAGSCYTVTASVPLTNAGTSSSYARLVDGSSTVIDAGKKMGSAGAGQSVSVTLQGPYVATGSSATFKVQGKTSNGTNAASIGQDADAPITWTISKGCTSQPQPLATGNVSSTTTGQLHYEFANVYNTCAISSTCTINNQSGAFSSITSDSSPTYTVNFVAGTFSAAPSCTFTGTSGVPKFNPFPTTSSVGIKFVDTAGAAQATSFTVQCSGPH